MSFILCVKLLDCQKANLKTGVCLLNLQQLCDLLISYAVPIRLVSHVGLS